MARNPVVGEDLKTIVSSDLPWEILFEKKVLISGANGFVPAYMLETLLYLNETVRAGIQVVALVRNYEKAMQRLGHLAGRTDLTMVVQDVRDPYRGPEKIDFLVHAASQASPKYYSSDPVGTFETNVLGTRRMLEVARDANSKGFLFFSSGEVYGRQGDASIAIKETSFGPLDPIDVRSCYGEGKRGGEALCACWCAQYGVPAKIVRLSHTYGPGMDLKDGRVFADFVADIVAGRDIVMKSDGSAQRPFCYLADATVAFFMVLLRGQNGQAYNVGTDSECSILGLAELLCGLFPERNCNVIRQQRRRDDPYVPSSGNGGHFDISKIKSLGWAPTTTIEAGFRRTIESYKSPE
ncbi:MAG: NAD-dependent epimerase/dehydratase family protein [Terracidiphilus sp.]